MQSSSVTGINVVLTNKLQPTVYDKASWKVHRLPWCYRRCLTGWQVWVKDYMKAILEKIDDKRKPIFKAGMPGACSCMCACRVSSS